MIWNPFLPNRIPHAVITQAAVSSNGSPGCLTVPGVVSFTTRDSQLMGVNKAGQVIVVVPLAQVAAAVIDEVAK